MLKISSTTAIMLVYFFSFIVINGAGPASNRCGTTKAAADVTCGQFCNPGGCTVNGEVCYSSLSTTPCQATRCGSDWSNANSKCGTFCKDDSHCPTGEKCFASMPTSVCASSPPPSNPPPTTTPPPTTNPPPTTIPANSCGNSRTLTLTDLRQIMNNPSLGSEWVNAINTAFERYNMNCPKRIVDCLAQVRHETAGMTVFFQPLDNGAGFLHMTPANWKPACLAVPEIAQRFAEVFPGCTGCSCTNNFAANPMSADSTKAAKEVFSKPIVAALSAAWWYSEGARLPSIFGWKGCGDLRLEADKGLGGAGASDCTHSGFYQTTCCIFWTIGGSAGLEQRKTFYANAKTVAKGWGVSWIEGDSVSNIDESQGNSMSLVGGLVGASVCLLVIIVVIVALVRRHRSMSEIV